MHLACATRLYLQVALRDDAHWDHFARVVDRGEIGRRGERLGEGGRGVKRFCQIFLICSVSKCFCYSAAEKMHILWGK